MCSFICMVIRSAIKHWIDGDKMCQLFMMLVWEQCADCAHHRRGHKWWYKGLFCEELWQFYDLVCRYPPYQSFVWRYRSFIVQIGTWQGHLSIWLDHSPTVGTVTSHQTTVHTFPLHTVPSHHTTVPHSHYTLYHPTTPQCTHSHYTLYYPTKS